MSIIPVITPGMKRLQSITPERAGVPQEQPEEEKPGILGRAAQLLQGYVEGVADPVAGAAAYMFSPSVRESYEEARAEGEGKRRALGAGWREGLTDTPSIKFDLPGQGIPLPFGKRFDEFQLGLKGAAELVLDPLNILPGVGYGGQIAKGFGKATGRRVGQSLGDDLLTTGGKITEDVSSEVGKKPLKMDRPPETAKEAAKNLSDVWDEYLGGTSDPNWRFYDQSQKQAADSGRYVDEMTQEEVEDLITRFQDAMAAAPAAQASRAKAVSEARRVATNKYDTMLDDLKGQYGGYDNIPPEKVSQLKAVFRETKQPKPLFDLSESAFTEVEIAKLRTMIYRKKADGTLKTFEFDRTNDAFNNLFREGALPTPSQLAGLEKVFGSKLVDNILAKRTGGQKLLTRLLEIWNLPKTLMASMDLSATLRQGALFIPEGGPYARALKEQFKALKSQKNVDDLYDSIRSHEDFADAVRSVDEGGYGLDITFPEEARFSVGRAEESFIGARIIEDSKIPFIKQLGWAVKVSNRAYAAFLNKARWDTYVKQKALLGDQATEAQLRDLARNINIMSGRQAIPGVSDEAAAFLNGMFFSPRFVWSRIQTPTLLIRQAMAPGGLTTPAGRQLTRMVAQDVLGYFTGVMGMLALAKASGVVDVELDPRSSDWGKAKYNNVRIDPWAGLQQPMRLVALLYSGERKQLETGKIKDVKPEDAIKNFILSKSHPTISAMLDLESGTTFTGEPITPQNMLMQSFTPLFFQDLAEMIEAEGVGAAAIAPLGLFGMSVYNIPEKYGTGDPDVDEELKRLGVFINKPGRKIQNIELSDEQHRKYDEDSRVEAVSLIKDIIGTKTYKVLPEAPLEQGKSEKQLILESAIRAARATARGKLLMELNTGGEVTRSGPLQPGESILGRVGGVPVQQSQPQQQPTMSIRERIGATPSP